MIFDIFTDGVYASDRKLNADQLAEVKKQLSLRVTARTIVEFVAATYG